VLGQGLGRDGRQGHRPLAGDSLGRADRELASDLKELLGHSDPAMQQIDPADAEPGQLAPAQAGVGSD
jgi:hypothetical protein